MTSIDFTKCYECGKPLDKGDIFVLPPNCSCSPCLPICSTCKLVKKIERLEKENQSLLREKLIYSRFTHGQFYDINGKKYLYIDRNTPVIFNRPGGMDCEMKPAVGVGTASDMGDEGYDGETIALSEEDR
jgi:hypothetical protein